MNPTLNSEVPSGDGAVLGAGLEAVLREFEALRGTVLSAPEFAKEALAAALPEHLASGRNLLQYMALRRSDLRSLQERLTALGLSSLGGAEAHVAATLGAVHSVLLRLTHQASEVPASDPLDVDFVSGHKRLEDNALKLLGRPPHPREVGIMVTMSTEEAADACRVQALLAQGMDCMRINCAHDEPAIWLQIIQNLRVAEAALGKKCRILMDLPGPKLRTGPLTLSPAVLRIRPVRNALGRVVVPAHVWLAADLHKCPPPSLTQYALPVPEAWLGQLRRGDRIRFRDTRGAWRILRVVEVRSGGCWARLRKTAYVQSGTKLRLCKGRGSARVGELAQRECAILLHRGDLLALRRDCQPGRPAQKGVSEKRSRPACIGCTRPEALSEVRVGEAVWFDDGKVGAVVERVGVEEVVLRVEHVRVQGWKLRSDRGINLPQSILNLSAVDQRDHETLRFIAAHADIVALSFCNTVQDLQALEEQLNCIGGQQPAVVLKIETRRGFENLPELLLYALRFESCGVMIARGDLAVECGFERLAEVQEEILWVCEAAHVPVIWATQVLETLAKEGFVSRAEVTDAAMSQRAECVMLNKGPLVLEAVRVLDDILQRMQGHQDKKRPMLRKLQLAQCFSTGETP